MRGPADQPPPAPDTREHDLSKPVTPLRTESHHGQGRGSWQAGGMRGPRLTSDRLRLVRWEPGHLAPFEAMGQDPEGMAWFPGQLSPEESRDLVARFEAHFEQHGFGFWAVERKEDGAFLGTAGLSIPTFEAPFTPCVEVGWRLARWAWGQGFATEAARAALTHCFVEVVLREILCWTVPGNQRSLAVMARLGFQPQGVFEHPRLPLGHPLRLHLLHRLPCDAWI